MLNVIMVDKLLDYIKKIKDIEKLYDYKILINTGNKLHNVITEKNVVMLILCIIKDDNKFYSQIFLGNSISSI